MVKFIGLEHGKKKMKTSIKIARLEKKIKKLQIELEYLNKPFDTFKQHMDASQSVYPAMDEQDGETDFIDHDVTRGVQY